MSSLDRFADAKLASLEARSLRRELVSTHRMAEAGALRAGAGFVEFCGNDYLSLTHHPRVVAASAAAAERYGTGAGASRLVTGNHPLLAELEAELAAFRGSEDCVVFGSGYLTNLGVLPCFVGPDDLVVVDAWSHACIHAGSSLSRSRVVRVPHADVDALAETLERHRADHPRCVVATDGVFSMDGDLAPLDRLAGLCEAHDAWLLVDDAHALGVVGEGRGTAAHFGVEVPLQVGTLSKTLASYGGYLCASRTVCDLVRTRARSFIYSTGLPPSAVAAALAALRVLRDEPARRERPLALATRFTRAVGLPDPQTPIVPWVLDDPGVALAASAALEHRGFLVTAIRPPTVPTARLRFTFAAGHTDAQVEALASAVLDWEGA